MKQNPRKYPLNILRNKFQTASKNAIACYSDRLTAAKIYRGWKYGRAEISEALGASGRVVAGLNNALGALEPSIVGYNNKSGVSESNIVGYNNKSGVSESNIVGCNNESNRL